MARGSKTSSLPSFSVSIKTGSKVDYPHFELKRKVGDDFILEEGLEKSLSGALVNVEMKEITAKDSGKKYELVNFTMDDYESEERYYIGAFWSNTTRSIINQFLALDSFDDVVVSLYEKDFEAKDGKVIKFAAASVTQGEGEDGKRKWHGVRFKHKEDIAPKIVVTKIPDKPDDKNFKAVHEMLMKEVDEVLTPKLKKFKPAQLKKIETEAKLNPITPESDAEENDDLPF